MRESMAQLTPRFSADRTVREYAEQHYLPAANVFQQRSASNGAFGRQVVDWKHSVDQKWPTLHFVDQKVETRGDQHLFEVQVFLDDLGPQAVRVELFANGVSGGPPLRYEMKRVRQLASASDIHVYSAEVSAARPQTDYTARVIPDHYGVAIPLEDARILWQR
jgi:starch phosphorylase